MKYLIESATARYCFKSITSIRYSKQSDQSGQTSASSDRFRSLFSVISCAKLTKLQVPAHSYSCRLYNQRSCANFLYLPSCNDFGSFHSCADFWSLHSFANFWPVLAHNQHSFICHQSCQLYNNTAVLCFGLYRHKISTASSAGTVVASTAVKFFGVSSQNFPFSASL